MESNYNNILVPVDGSAQSEDALAKGALIAHNNGAHLDVLHVLSTQQYGYNYGGMVDGDVINNLVEDTTDYLNKSVDRIKKEADLDDIQIHIRFGNPKTVIAFEFPKDHKSDLIVMGATGMSRLQRVLEGSVSSFVNRSAKCDVMVVRTNKENKPYKPVENN
ncbi:universal stress protein [Lentilactobacillus sp. IMAU92037]|uniref:universal stress protein n=1 Tax=Lentilactobacillus dabitei TaxID=2831523 RepID=UPI001C280F45|nr:universal stress protein [Lentilactobacillus dabitei]MBU9790155.1 universal stress protein [Lentilactobacillus dabitei]MBV0930937.1 universal stress protein [Lentilactobacillus dabitei]